MYRHRPSSRTARGRVRGCCAPAHGSRPSGVYQKRRYQKHGYQKHRYQKHGSQHARRLRSSERGQATIALAGVLVIVALSATALALVAEAMVDRERARTAADSVALASAVDGDLATELAAIYRGRGIDVDQVQPFTVASRRPSRAHAWAALVPSDRQPPPVLVAIVARAAQLTGAPFTTVQFTVTGVATGSAEVDRFRSVAAEFGLCESTTPASSPDRPVFTRC